MKNLQEMLAKSEGLRKAVSSSPHYMKSSFKGYWKPVIYASLVFSIIYGAMTFGLYGGMLAIPGLVFFWLCTQYDEILVDIHNRNIAETVMMEYVVNNVSEFLDVQDPDSKGNLDGTNEDE